MKNCHDNQIFSISTNRCIKIASPTFKKRLKEQLEKNVLHFSVEDLITKGYNVQTMNKPEKTQRNKHDKIKHDRTVSPIKDNTLTNKIKHDRTVNPIKDNTLTNKIKHDRTITDKTKQTIIIAIDRDAKKQLSEKTKNMILLKTKKTRNDIHNEFRYVEDNQKNYCNKNSANKLFEKPLITKTINYDFTYLTSRLRGVFTADMLEYDKDKPWGVEFLSSTINSNSSNYDRMNPLMDEVEEKKFMEQLDIKWFNETNEYISKLDVDELFAMKAYTFFGDTFINNRMRGTLDIAKILDTFSLEKKDQYTSKYFPLFFPILEIIFNGYELEQLTDDVTSKTEINKLKKIIQDIKLFQMEKTNKTHIDYFNDTDRLKLYVSIVHVARILKEEVIIMAIDKLAFKVDSIVKRSPPTRKKMIVYRGDKDDTYFNKNTGDVFFKNKGLISTSLSYDKAFGFTRELSGDICCINEITILPGSKILFVGGVSSIPDEIEFILGLNTTYLMRKYREKKYIQDFMICNDEQRKRQKVFVTSLVALGKK
jgi:hypothetical protein